MTPGRNPSPHLDDTSPTSTSSRSLMMMVILPAAAALLLGDRLPQSGICRRPLVFGASTLLGGCAFAPPQAAQAGDFSFDPNGSWLREAPDGSWTDHDGPFDDAFFKDFKSTETGFVYKFIREGDGDKPVQGQSVLMHYTGYLLNGKVCLELLPCAVPRSRHIVNLGS